MSGKYTKLLSKTDQKVGDFFQKSFHGQQSMIALNVVRPPTEELDLWTLKDL